MTSASAEPRGRVLRALASQVTFWATAALSAFFIVDAVLRGAWPILLRWGVLIALIVFVLWLLLVHSSITLFRDRIVVRNFTRIHDIPWGDVVGVTVGPVVVLELGDGSTVKCLGAPFPPRPGARRRRGPGGYVRAPSSQPIAGEPSRALGAEGGQDEIRVAFENARSAGLDVSARATSRWEINLIAVGALLGVVGVSLAFAAR